MSVPLVLLAIVAGLLVVPAKGTPLTVRLDVGLAWLAALSIFVLVPLDVASTLQGQQQQQHRLGILWKVTYWYGFIAQFTLLPFHQVRRLAAPCATQPMTQAASHLGAHAGVCRLRAVHMV